MLQQTRVETVIPYYQSWMKRFPTLPTLAQATQQEVLAAWEGLGYYSRARNLHRAAQFVLYELDGELPRDMTALSKLPGVGRYTAGAIASIAFGVDAPALDGNIRRVLARVFDVELPARSPAGEHRLWELAASHLPSGQASAYNQALMDLGATLCTPRAPQCERCPLLSQCQAHALGVQEQRPVSQAKPPVPHYIVTAAVIQRGEQVLIAQRPADGLLGGLWEFPGGKQEQGEDLATCLKREIIEELGVEIDVTGHTGTYRHAYTHFRVTLHAFYCQLVNGAQPRPLQVNDLRWVKPADLANYPMGKIDRQIAQRLNLLEE
jgi:A/G-specific adenine glycosylase